MKRFGRAYKRRGQVEAGRMNNTEKAYANHLELKKLAGDIVEYKYEAIKLRLADRTFYTPDFFVQGADDVMQIHEVKGYWEDDARVKIKVAAKEFPEYRFIAATKGKKNEPQWIMEEF